MMPGLIDLPAGAAYVPDFVAAAEEAACIAALDGGAWDTTLKRRVQHFGYRYDYRARTVTADAYLGPLPDWLEALCGRLVEGGYFARRPDQVIANEYLPGQGISAHVDCEPCFGDDRLAESAFGLRDGVPASGRRREEGGRSGAGVAARDERSGAI
jgi:alkylated DNA repair dioxygenase AlkB